jgi:transcriptional regulator with XRE-family HTH domain
LANLLCCPRSSEIRTVIMKGAHFRRALADLNLTQEEGAKLFGLSLRTINDYVNGHTRIPKPVGILTNLLVGGAVTLDRVDAVG